MFLLRTRERIVQIFNKMRTPIQQQLPPPLLSQSPFPHPHLVSEMTFPSTCYKWGGVGGAIWATFTSSSQGIPLTLLVLRTICKRQIRKKDLKNTFMFSTRKYLDEFSGREVTTQCTLYRPIKITPQKRVLSATPTFAVSRALFSQFPPFNFLLSRRKREKKKLGLTNQVLMATTSAARELRKKGAKQGLTTHSKTSRINMTKYFLLKKLTKLRNVFF